MKKLKLYLLRRWLSNDYRAMREGRDSYRDRMFTGDANAAYMWHHYDTLYVYLGTLLELY